MRHAQRTLEEYMKYGSDSLLKNSNPTPAQSAAVTVTDDGIWGGVDCMLIIENCLSLGIHL